MLKEGKIYKVDTAMCRRAVCIYNTSEDRALFAIDNPVTPFVSWWHSPVKDDGETIDCACGTYYRDLASAVEGEKVVCVSE